MMAAEYALPIPGSASSCSALAELMSSRSDLAAGAIFDSVAGALGAGAILSDLAAGWAVWAIDGEAVSRPRVSAVAASEASVKRRIGCVPPRTGLSNAIKVASHSWRCHGCQMNGR